ncbi:MAG: winged helix-turn-helix domain-containing protein, partial [Bacteroidota bacterium]
MEPATDILTTDRPLPTLIRVGDWRVEPMANRLLRGGEERRVEPKVMEVLVCMARRPGETVSRDAFMAEVWAGTIVTDDVLARCISELRKALGDSARAPEYVETIRKRGYRLIAPVRIVTEQPSGETAFVARPASGHAARRDALQKRKRTRGRLVTLAVLGLVVAASAAYASYRWFAGRVSPLASVPVTSLPGVERDPALSPDGQTVAFAWDGGESGPSNVYVQPASVESAGQAVPITASPADDHSPAWHPDGARLAFARCQPQGCDVYTAAADGSDDPAPLAELDRFQIRQLIWSPDGTQLAFSGRRGGSGAYSLHLLPLDGSPPQRLTAPPATFPGDLYPAFSPDGTRLAFVRTRLDGQQDVCTVPITGGTVERHVLEQKGVTGLDWSTDGREIVYAANREGTAGLWRVRPDGSGPQWVALGTDIGEVSEPSIADEGRGLVFAQRLSRTQIVGVYRDGQPEPVISSTREDTQPHVSPDGTQIAFVSTRSGAHEVWIATRDGQAPRLLTSFGGPRVSTPRWSPDGERLVVAARRSGSHADLFLVEPSGETRQLTDGPGDELAPSWSRDGEWIYFASPRDPDGAWQIYRMPTAGGDAQAITRYGGVAAMEALDG